MLSLEKTVKERDRKMSIVLGKGNNEITIQRMDPDTDSPESSVMKNP